MRLPKSEVFCLSDCWVDFLSVWLIQCCAYAVAQSEGWQMNGDVIMASILTEMSILRSCLDKHAVDAPHLKAAGHICSVICGYVLFQHYG